MGGYMRRRSEKAFLQALNGIEEQLWKLQGFLEQLAEDYRQVAELKGDFE